MGNGVRTKRLLEQVLEHQAATDVRYTGIDLFEARPAGQPGMSLKQAHATFKPYGIKSQFIPGDPFSAIARAANGLLQTDVIIVRAALCRAGEIRATAGRENESSPANHRAPGKFRRNPGVDTGAIWRAP